MRSSSNSTSSLISSFTWFHLLPYCLSPGWRCGAGGCKEKPECLKIVAKQDPGGEKSSHRRDINFRLYLTICSLSKRPVPLQRHDLVVDASQSSRLRTRSQNDRRL